VLFTAARRDHFHFKTFAGGDNSICFGGTRWGAYLRRNIRTRQRVLSGMSPASVASIINRIMRATGPKRTDVQRVLPEIVTPQGRLTSRWREVLRNSFRPKFPEPAIARFKAKNKMVAKKKKKQKVRRRQK
jgi:hypothetical protein